MFLGHTNPKLLVSVNIVVPDLCEITEPKKQLKVEIPLNLKKFCFVKF